MYARCTKNSFIKLKIYADFISTASAILHLNDNSFLFFFRPKPTGHPRARSAYMTVSTNHKNLFAEIIIVQPKTI